MTAAAPVIVGHDRLGRPIRRTDAYQRMMAKTRQEGGCVVYTGTRSCGGYGKVGVQGVPGGKQFAHRISFEHHHGPIPAGGVICHRCDNPPCVNPAHLFLGDQRINMLDAIAKGRKAPTRGDRNRRSKLTAVDVRDIRRRAAAGESQVAIARRFTISPRSVGGVVNRERWAWVDDLPEGAN